MLYQTIKVFRWSFQIDDGESSRDAVYASRKMKASSVLFLCSLSVALAEDFKAINGKEYKNARVSRVEPDGIVLVTSSGISKVYFIELPQEVQERFDYDAAKATAYSVQQAATQEAFRNSKRNYDGHWPNNRKQINRVSFSHVLCPSLNEARRSR